jgi:tetratricopeptide (TPR) repeat protein
MPAREQSMEAFVSQQKAAARHARENRRLAESLSLWRSVLPLDVDDVEVNTAIADLEKQIDSQSRELLGRAEVAYARGSRREGDTLMLKVLALQPGQERALAELRKSTSARTQAQQVAKNKEENQVQLARQKKSPGSVEYQLHSLYAAGDYTALLATSAGLKGEPDAEIARLLRSTHVAMADQAARQGQRDAELEHLMSAITVFPAVPDPLLDRSVVLRKELSKEWYQRGNGLMKGDLPGAIAALEKSLGYNPENRLARLKLKQARVLQRNLLKIQGNSSVVD